MTEILKLYKNVGETPLECIQRYRVANPSHAATNMTYLGRLDPMAEGVLLVLAGDTSKKKQYLEMNKTYEFDVLWGFETDTYDVLGLVTSTGSMPLQLEAKMDKMLANIRSKKTQAYPPYSSRTVGGKALLSWAREGKIGEVDIPTRSIKIFDISHIRTKLMKQSDILKEILEKVSLVEGDFRQGDISTLWRQIIKPGEFALVSTFSADVSSGTYIRSLSHEMGKMMDTCALAYGIKRTRVGDYKLDNL